MYTFAYILFNYARIDDIIAVLLSFVEGIYEFE